MIAEAIDRSLEEFEKHTSSPATIQKAARILERFVKRGFDADLVQEIQGLRLGRAMPRIAHRSPFYRERFDNLGLDPLEVTTPKDLGQLPFRTAGTTGEPKRVYHNATDLQRLLNLSAVAMRAGHPGRLSTLIALPMRHGLWMGWASAYRVVPRAGGLPLPVGAPDPGETLRWMRRFEPDVLMSSPPYLTALTDQAEAEGFRPALDKILVGGELLTPEQEERFEDYWRAPVFDSYGSTEIGGAQTIVLPDCRGFHLNDLHLLTEVIDPESGQPAEEGELVFTTLVREAMPLVRYRSGDLARRVECPCWLPFPAVQLDGRVDDMFVAGDLNLYAQVIADAADAVPGTSSRIAIEVEKVDLTDRLQLRIGGRAVDPQEVREALFDAYPALRPAMEADSLRLEVETGVDLSDQIKTVQIRDRRE